MHIDYLTNVQYKKCLLNIDMDHGLITWPVSNHVIFNFVFNYEKNDGNNFVNYNLTAPTEAVSHALNFL